MKTLIIHTGELKVTQKEIDEDIARGQGCADNIFGWACRKIIMTTQLKCRYSIAKAATKLLQGEEKIIDLRI